MPYHYWGMHDWSGWMAFHAAFWLLLVALVIWTAISLSRNSRSSDRGTDKSALDLLKERYARGEIDREEYLQRKKDIEEQ